MSRLLARWDRGDFPRPLETWQELFSERFDPVVFQPYPLGALAPTSGAWSISRDVRGRRVKGLSGSPLPFEMRSQGAGF